MINPTPTFLRYDGVGYGNPKIDLLSSANNAAIAEVDIQWKSHSGSSIAAPSGWFTGSGPGCASSNQPCFRPYSEWSYLGKPVDGIIQAAFTPIFSSLPTNTDNTMTAFFYPISNGRGGTVIVNNNDVGANSGITKAAYCTSSSCSEKIIFSKPSNNILMYLSSIYNKSDITVVARDSSGTALPLQNAQALIDSTGDVKGVLKRIQVTVPLTNDNAIPDATLGTAGPICKDLNAYPGSASSICGL